MEATVLLEPTRAVVGSGVPMKKASAPSARQARAKNLTDIIFDSERVKKRRRGRVGGTFCVLGFGRYHHRSSRKILGAAQKIV